VIVTIGGFDEGGLWGGQVAVSGSIVESLTTLGLVAGFPLLLLCFMLSLEKLESWGLRDFEPSDQAPLDLVDAAVEEVAQMTATQALPGESDESRWPVAAQHGGQPGGRPA
jgi:hypothetical protein